jgi:SAM-dependent methyltransferase
MDFTGERLIPDQQRADDLYHEHIVRYIFAAQFVPGRAVLDAGCGAGYGAAALAAAGALSVLGVDIAPDAVAYAQQHYQRAGLTYAVADIAKIDVLAERFDLIVSFEVIEHLESPALLVEAAARLLNPDGLFVVSTPNPATYPAGNPFHKHEMGQAEFVETLRQSFAALAMFEQDYATAIALRPNGVAHGAGWQFVPADKVSAYEPDYYVAVCAHQQQTLDAALSAARAVMYELPTDRLDQRIHDLVTVQEMLDAKNRHLLEKDAHIAALEQELQRQSVWAAGLEQRLHALSDAWYVRLFGRGRR